uniref:Glucanase n=1 Tax=Talaromyces piceae TaxID=153982 RepID=A0A2D2AGX9_9EURO|nr:endo-beta-1,4-glucanase [Talaromyces piceae]
MAGILALGVLAALPLASAQSRGTADAHPQLVTYKCTTGGGCQEQSTSVVLDFTFHWIHEKDGDTPCTNNGSVDSSLCPDTETCTQNCVVDGTTDYAATGVSTSGSSLTLHQFTERSNGELDVTSSRLYLLDSTGEEYVQLQLLNQEFSFDVDVSTLVCGMNGALYLSEMQSTGGQSSASPAGAAFGAGYCDAQCPTLEWLNGTVNTNGLGACCGEMDLWEANAYATQLTPHPCTEPGVYACSGDECGSSGVCEKGGCGFNPYAMGVHDFYQPGGTVDTNHPFTVVTQFISSDNTTSGQLSEIRRLYIQNGTVIQNAAATVSSVEGQNSISDGYCSAIDSVYSEFGGLATAGEALQRGMTLVFSIWDDSSQFMNWLDSGDAGPCSSDAGNPETIEQQAPNASVTFSNIKWGDIGSTYASGSTSKLAAKRAHQHARRSGH